MPYDDTIREQALYWAVLTGDPDFGRWDEFTAWLEADPRHGQAYDEISAAVADGAEALAAAPVPANDIEEAAAKGGAQLLTRRRWFGMVMAACVGAVVLAGYWQSARRPYTVETAPGEMRQIALEDGGSIQLSGGSRLTLEHDDSRFARLESGQALFSVEHDAAHPFVVLAGEDRLVDAGTVFDVAYESGLLQLEVSEGLVIFNPDRQAVSVRPGEKLEKRAGASDYRVFSINPALVGEWRDGRATFQNASLEDVAARLSRLTGIEYVAGAAGGSLTGSILVESLRDDPAAIGPLLGVSIRQQGDAWVIAAP